MKTLINLFCILLISYNISNAQQKPAEFSKLTSPYLGQKPPGNNPELFAPGIVSTGNFEHSSPVFTPDLSEIYWSTILEENNKTIARPTYYMKNVNGEWSKPEIPTFGKKFQRCENPFISPDGKRIYFSASVNLQNENYDLYYAERDGKGWGNTNNIGEPINSVEHGENQSTVAVDGTLYFIGFYDKASPQYGLYYSKYKDGKYLKPVLMEEKFNQRYADWTPYISPDQDYFIFCSFRKGGYGSGDLYISFRQKDGSWGEVKNMGNKINSPANERFANVSPDRKFLFFNSTRKISGADDNSPGNGKGDIYWVSSGIIDYLKNEDLNITDILYNSILKNGSESVLLKYNQLKAKHSEFYNFDQSVLYTVGLHLLENKQIKEAINIFKLNMELYPDANITIQKLLSSLHMEDKSTFDELSMHLISKNQKEKAVSENDLNNLGYRLMNAGLVKESIMLLILNTKLFPESSNVYNSLAEAYEKAGNTDLAVENHEKSLKINPENSHSIDALKRLKEKK